MTNRARELNGAPQAWPRRQCHSGGDDAGPGRGGRTRHRGADQAHTRAVGGNPGVDCRQRRPGPPINRGAPADLIILDLNLPVVSGTEVCRILRARPETAHLPVIMLTARTADRQGDGAGPGCRRLWTKPFSLRRRPRVRAVLRRRQSSFAAKGSVYRGERLVADLDAVAVSVDGRSVSTRREFELLRFRGKQEPCAVTRSAAGTGSGLRPVHRDPFGRRSCTAAVRQARHCGHADRNCGRAGLPLR